MRSSRPRGHGLNRHFVIGVLALAVATGVACGEPTTAPTPTPLAESAVAPATTATPTSPPVLVSTPTPNVVPTEQAIATPRAQPTASAGEHLAAGVALSQEGRYVEALVEFGEAIRLDTQDAEAYKGRAFAYMSLNREFEQVIQDFDEAIRIDPQDAEAYRNRGFAYNRLRQPERAIEDYDEAIRLDPQDAEAYRNRGVAYHILGQLERAIEDHDEAIMLDPQDAEAYKSRAMVYLSLGQNEQAIQDFDEAIGIGPPDAETYFNRGVSYVRIGQRERGVQDHTAAITLDPRYTPAYYNRAFAYTRQGEDSLAEQDIDRAVELGIDRELLESQIDQVKQERLTLTPTPTATATPTVTPTVTTITPTPTPNTLLPTPTPTPTATPVALAQGNWSMKMVTSRGDSFYPNLEVNFSQKGGVLSGTGPYTYSSGGTTLLTEVLSGTVDSTGNVILNFTVKEGTSLRATFRFTGKAGSVPPSTRNKISGDPVPDAGSGFEPCAGACGYEAILEGGDTEIGFFTMSNQSATPTNPPTATPTTTGNPPRTPTPTPTPTGVAPTPFPPPTATAEPVAVESDILNFELEDLTIKVGTTVTWTNRDAALHTSTSGVSSIRDGIWDSLALNTSQNFSFTFQELGEFPYWCTIHPFMTATVTVTE